MNKSRLTTIPKNTGTSTGQNVLLLVDDEVAPSFKRGKILNFYNCTDSCNKQNCGDWCCGFWCLSCFLGNNTESKYLTNRDCFTDCCLSALINSWLPCLGWCLVNKWQRHDLEGYQIVAQDSCGACMCAPCVACETARALKHLEAEGVPTATLDSGMTKQLLVSTQPKAQQLPINIAAHASCA